MKRLQPIILALLFLATKLSAQSTGDIVVTRRLEVSAPMLEARAVYLRAEDVDTFCDISINGHYIGSTKNHFRPDYSSYHMLDYDPATGGVLRKKTVQGYADESAWARGQAWALYGYTMMYRETGREEFLHQAECIARLLLSRLPADGIPYWNFDDPDIPDTYRDASAAAVMCSAFIELSTLTKNRKLSKQCSAIAETQIRTLASPEYLAAPGENGGFLLKHSVGNLPGGSEIDTPLIYADYYFLETLNRYNAL